MDGVSDEIGRGELKNQIHVLYIGILPSRMHLVAISGYYHPLVVIQYLASQFQN